MTSMAAPGSGPTTIDPERRGVGWLEDRFRTAGRHRDAARIRHALEGVFLQVVTVIGTVCAILATRTRKYGWTVAAMAAFTVAGFSVSATRGWLVLGAALVVMEYRTRE